MIVEIEMTEGLLRQWNEIVRAYRMEPRLDGSLAAQAREEDRLSARTVRQIYEALMRHKPAALDCEIIDAVDRAKAAHDGAFSRETLRIGKAGA